MNNKDEFERQIVYNFRYKIDDYDEVPPPKSNLQDNCGADEEICRHRKFFLQADPSQEQPREDSTLAVREELLTTKQKLVPMTNELRISKIEHRKLSEKIKIRQTEPNT